MADRSILDLLLEALPALRSEHAPDTELHELLAAVARREVEDSFGSREARPVDFGPFGSLRFPYHGMGAVDSLNLFDLDELILFAFYWANRNRYRRVADIGANIGLHSIVLARCGYEVRAFEPDPEHLRVLEANLERNGIEEVEAVPAAVSDHGGTMEFVRVLGNTTGSHLSGSKADPYGELERFPVTVQDIADIIDWADLLKVDAEGHERQILIATTADQWRDTDAIVEVSSRDNAAALYEHFSGLEVSLYAQRLGWRRVEEAAEMPTSYRDGSLFVTTAAEVPW